MVKPRSASLHTLSGFELTIGNEAWVGRFHQGQQAETLHQQAGYKTATGPSDAPNQTLQSGSVHIKGMGMRAFKHPGSVMAFGEADRSQVESVFRAFDPLMSSLCFPDMLK